MTYDFHPEARLEYREAAAFYETVVPVSAQLSQSKLKPQLNG